MELFSPTPPYDTQFMPSRRIARGATDGGVALVPPACRPRPVDWAGFACGELVGRLRMARVDDVLAQRILSTDGQRPRQRLGGSHSHRADRHVRARVGYDSHRARWRRSLAIF